MALQDTLDYENTIYTLGFQKQLLKTYRRPLFYLWLGSIYQRYITVAVAENHHMQEVSYIGCCKSSKIEILHQHCCRM